MATLKHVQDSQSGETLTASETPSSYIPKTEDSMMAAKNIIFRMVSNRKGRTYIDGVCDSILNPKTKKRERIWLINGADSIWQSELTELLKDKEYVRLNRRSLLFEGGVCRILSTDDNALEFARRNKNNVGKNRLGNGKFDFYEYDAQEEQKMRLEKQTRKIQTVIKVNDMPDDRVKKLALFLDIPLVDEMGYPKGVEGIKAELLMKADSNPELVEKYMGSKEVEISWLVRKAIMDALIDLQAQPGNALWAGGKGFIAKIPAGRKTYEYLTELAMTNSEEGRNFIEQLKQVVT